MPRATSERLALSLRLCASQLGPARGQRPKPTALPSAAVWSSSPLQSGPSLAGASVGTLGKEWDRCQECWLQSATQKGFPSQVLPLSWQVTTALPSQGTDGSLATCLLRSLGAAETTQAQVKAFRNTCVKLQQLGKQQPAWRVLGEGGGCRQPGFGVTWVRSRPPV